MTPILLTWSGNLWFSVFKGCRIWFAQTLNIRREIWLQSTSLRFHNGCHRSEVLDFCYKSSVSFCDHKKQGFHKTNSAKLYIFLVFQKYLKLCLNISLMCHFHVQQSCCQWFFLFWLVWDKYKFFLKWRWNPFIPFSDCLFPC